MNEIQQEHVRASPWKRILAFVIDYVLVILPYLGLMSLAGWGLRSNGIHLFDPSQPERNQLLVILLLTIPIASYFAISEASKWQATIGKRCMKLFVTTQQGHPLSLKQSLLRAFLKFIMWEYFHTILWQWEGWPSNPQPPTTVQIVAMSIGWLLMALMFAGIFLRSRRTIYDDISGAVVTTRSTE